MYEVSKGGERIARRTVPCYQGGLICTVDRTLIYVPLEQVQPRIDIIISASPLLTPSLGNDWQFLGPFPLH